MIRTLVFDAGNSIIKGLTGGGKECEFPHALQLLSEAEYQNILTRAGQRGAGDDYLRINGQPLVVGESAERHGVITRRAGAARYTPDYYGLLAGAMMARCYQTGGDVRIFASHAPQDLDFRSDLMSACLGKYHIEINNQERSYFVKHVNTFDEPAGGLWNVILSSDGGSYRRKDINEGWILVVDCGGHTIDFLSLAPGAQADYSLNVSVPVGINQAVADFEKSLRSNNRAAFKQVNSLRPQRVREALASGVFVGGGREFDCENEATEATSNLLNQISDAYSSQTGGGFNYDTIILTGGGSAMLYDRLLPVLNHNRVILAEESEHIHFANVRGGLKLRKLYDHLDGQGV